MSCVVLVGSLAAAPLAAQQSARSSLGISATVQPSCAVDLSQSAGVRPSLQLRCGEADLRRVRISVGDVRQRAAHAPATGRGAGRTAIVAIDTAAVVQIDF